MLLSSRTVAIDPPINSPCSMCSGAILLYGIPRVVIGENKNFVGEEELLRTRGVEVVVLADKKCEERMTAFIKERSEVGHLNL